MPSLFDDTVNTLRGVGEELAGRTVTLRRGSAEVTITAVPGETSAEESTGDEGYDLAVTVRYRDYKIRASAYDFGDGPVAPEVDDRILDGDDVWQVVAPPGQPHYRRSGVSGGR
ncbi:MAG: hypothetical protein AAGJ97_05985, partial [Planctomycetota bacterium]